MRQFEYRILNASDLTVDGLNGLGKEGWELVCSTQSILYGSCLVLKREIGPGGGAPPKRDG